MGDRESVRHDVVRDLLFSGRHILGDWEYLDFLGNLTRRAHRLTIVLSAWSIHAPFVCKSLKHAVRAELVDLSQAIVWYLVRITAAHVVVVVVGLTVQTWSARHRSCPCQLRRIEHYRASQYRVVHTNIVSWKSLTMSR